MGASICPNPKTVVDNTGKQPEDFSAREQRNKAYPEARRETVNAPQDEERFRKKIPRQ
jgi:hypothetical protein